MGPGFTCIQDSMINEQDYVELGELRRYMQSPRPGDEWKETR